MEGVLNDAEQDSVIRPAPRVRAPRCRVLRPAGWPSRFVLGRPVMGMSYRVFLLDQEDGLYRLSSTRFVRMLQDPGSHRFARFAGSRIRMTELIVELADRQAIRIAWIMFGVLDFDEEGFLDASAYERQQRARAELALATPIVESDDASVIIDAARRFVARGGSWSPSRKLAQSIEAAALGRVKCPRL